MAVPKKKTSKSKRNMRRSHHALTPQFSVLCPQCGGYRLRHRACGDCGTYRTRQVLNAEQEVAVQAE